MSLSPPRRIWSRLDRLLTLEPYLYLVVAALVTLTVARGFYQSQNWQLGQSVAWALGPDFDPARREVTPAIWSAPLDDVFIHFDFARSAARGHPFEWIDGNGYSSGGTSLLYPLVLALGLFMGFYGLSLMHFAAIVAATSVLALLLGLRLCFRDLPRRTTYLLPWVMLSVGALNWSLFSGMEVAFFLAIWALGLYLADRVALTAATATDPLGRSQVAFALGSFLIAVTRPEAVTTIAVLSISCAVVVYGKRGRKDALVTLLAGAVPGAIVVLSQAWVNHRLTGDSAAAGALVKLELNNPLLTTTQVLEAYWSHLKYQIFRVTEYHFADNPVTGWVVWVFAVISLIPKSTRRYGIILWLSLLGWVTTVALNGQVRWQNERYAMPAVAWLLAAAALGLGAAVSLRFQTQVSVAKRAAVLVVTGALVCAFVLGEQRPYRDQRWFFGRASRNIFDQHVQTGHLLRIGLKPEPHRVLVGDAGAMTYVSDLPGLDIIGLGGTFGLPFARASHWGVGAQVELIQHLPQNERPDVLAIYPGWWGSLPLWFTSSIVARVPVRGNVICGGHTKVVYRSDFSSLDDAERPFTLRTGERVVDAVDFADVVSERAHDFKLDRRGSGFVDMKKLPHPENREQDLFDAGRISFPGLLQTFKVKGLTSGKPHRLLLRVAPVAKSVVEFVSAGRSLGKISLEPSDDWQEVSLVLPPDFGAAASAAVPVELHTREGGPTLYFLWVLQTQ